MTLKSLAMRILLLFFLLLGYTAYAQPETSAQGIEYLSLFDSTSKTDVSCYRIPALLTATNGDLIAAIDERVSSCGDLKFNDNINIVIRRSKDGGESWSAIETVVDYPLGHSASDPSMMLDKESGEIFLFFNYMNLEREKDVYYLRMVRSLDHGKSWSEPVDITSQITKPEWHHDFKFITSGRGIQTSSGKLLHTLVHLEKGVFLFGSDDRGKSWFLIDTPIQPADESKVIELADGRWMVNSRVNGAGMRYVHISSDEGKSWHTQADSTLVDPGCNASIIRYTSVKEGGDKNRLLFSHAHAKEDRKNMTIRLSYDEGKSWTAGKTIYAGSAAYSSMSVLADGSIVLFFEKDNYRDNVVVRFTLDWLTNGNDKYIKSSSK